MFKKNSAILTIFIFILVLSVGSGMCACSQSDIEFTQENWNRHIWKRYRMLNSLYEQYDLSEMTKEDIIDLLGLDGTANNYDHSLDFYIKKDIVSPLLLGFSFDDNGNVIRFDIYSD